MIKEIKSKKILLINPPYKAELYFGKLAGLRYIFPPMGILSLAAYIREKGYKVKVYDFEVFEEDFIKTLKDFEPEVVGITCPTILVESTVGLSRLIKKHLPDTLIIVGGPHPSARPRDLIKTDAIDIAVRGEGEIIFEELLEALTQQKPLTEIKGINYKENDTFIENPNMPLIKDLSYLPMPAIDLVPINKYIPSPDLAVGKRGAALYTSRGCPYKCIFCANNISFDFKYRERPMNKIFDEIDYYIKEYNIDSLMIMDDTFCINYDRVKEFCIRFIEHGWNKKIKWWAQTRVDRIDDELLGIMKEAGCNTLSLGLESGSQKILDGIKKEIDIKKVRPAIKLINKHKIVSRASFILGLPNETFGDSIKTILFALSLPLDFCKFSLATPYPGTELWDIATKEGKLSNDTDWKNFSQMAGFTENDLLYVWGTRSQIILKLLQRIANALYYIKPSVLYGMFKRFYNMGETGKFFSTILTGMKAVVMPSSSKNK